ncbi:MAG: nicotinate-nucleotide diphosphorylase (carboxylating) [Phycisphaerae bacterium]|nr:nicotinate-nucleotide diphosphorylase (carboxylating) [Phycisphaerae bacterium]
METIDLNKLALPDRGLALVPDGELTRVLASAIEEDGVLRGDITTSSIVPEGREVVAEFVSRDSGVLAGMDLLVRASQLAPLAGRVRIEACLEDGRLITSGQVVGRIHGTWRDVLTFERTLLNLVSRLCGVATRTARFVAAAGNGVLVTDSRKTTPGLRLMEKYAVACGGGYLHRIGLDDAVMYKDNHLAAVAPESLASTLSEAIRRARADRSLRFICVEVDRLQQLDVVLSLDMGLVDIVLLDNMDPSTLREAVRRRDACESRMLLEASGGVTLETVAAIAATGVERIAVGSITHGATWLDIGLDIQIDEVPR